MRDVIIFIIVFGAIPFILYRPYVGVLVWSWLGYMNPHRLTWGFAYDFPFAQIVGLVTLIAMVFSKERKWMPFNGLVIVWLLWVVWMNISTVFAITPHLAWQEWDRTMKIQLFSVVTLMLMKGQQRITYLVTVIAIGLGFFGVKGGLFSALTGGNFRVWGPPGSFIEGNNAMGLAMVMVVPLMWYLSSRAQSKMVRYGIYGSIGLTMLAILTTHSRGAFLAIGAMLAFVWLKSRQKIWLGVTLAVALPALWMVMPEQWHERMASILEYQSDGSALGRINAWYFAFNLALDRPLVGGGFQAFTPGLFMLYAPDPEDFHDAHSIYFEVLGEHGFPGLFLFLSLGYLALRSAAQIVRQTASIPELLWAHDLAAMLQASLVGYAVGGLFLGLAYFDLYYHLVVLVVLLQVAVEDFKQRSKPPPVVTDRYACTG